MNTFPKVITSILQVNSPLPRWPPWNKLVQRDPRGKEPKVPLAKPQQGTENIRPPVGKEMNLANINVSLEADPCPLEAAAGSPALADTMTTALWGPEAEGREMPVLQQLSLILSLYVCGNLLPSNR